MAYLSKVKLFLNFKLLKWIGSCMHGRQMGDERDGCIQTSDRCITFITRCSGHQCPTQRPKRHPDPISRFATVHFPDQQTDTHT